MQERLAALEQRYQALGEEMSKPEVATDRIKLLELARERAQLEGPVTLLNRLRDVETGIAEASELAADGHDTDLGSHQAPGAGSRAGPAGGSCHPAQSASGCRDGHR